MKLTPLADRVILKMVEVEETTKGGIILTASAKEKPSVAEVISVGPGGMVDGHDVVMTVKPGDKVITSKYAGTEVKLDDEEYVVVRQSDILLIDDIAKRKLNETGGELLYRLVNAVYEGAATRLWITSNKDLAPLLQRFENGDTGDAVISRFDRLIDDERMSIYRV